MMNTPPPMFKSLGRLALLMHFEQLNEGVWAMTYLIVDPSTKQAALVDPVYDYMDAYLERLEKDGLTLVYAIASHTHADHITACFLSLIHI